MLLSLKKSQNEIFCPQKRAWVSLLLGVTSCVQYDISCIQEISNYYMVWFACHRKTTIKPNELDFLALQRIFISTEIPTI